MTQHSERKLITAVIPAAGLGTRLFPATKAVKKEFFPVVGPDGIARPAIQHIVEEALSAGVEEVILVVRPDDLPVFQAFFTEPLPAAHAAKLPSTLRNYADRLIEMGQHIQFAVQPRQEGFGHAVFCAREQVGERPFLLLLGDHLYRSAIRYTCVQQLTLAYQQHGGSLVGLTTTPESEIASRGIVAGMWIEEARLLQIRRFAEKPSVEEARRALRTTLHPVGEYLALFGQYILEPLVFDILAAHIQERRRERGEFQLTAALDALREESGCMGLMIQGRTYDIGQPRLYVEALQAFSAGTAGG